MEDLHDMTDGDRMMDDEDMWPETLKGLRILVAEDNFLVAELLRDTLEEWGCQVVGPAPRVEQGELLARETMLDGALLDVNLAGQTCYPIAAALRERSVPFVFLSGYGDLGPLPEAFKNAPKLTKPVTQPTLAKVMGALFR